MSRLRTLIVFGTVLALAVVFAACGGSGGGSSDANPQTVVDNATLQGIDSGNLDLSVGIDVKGDKGGHIDVGLSGPFQSQGKGQPPQLAMTAKVNGSINSKDVNFEGGLTLLADRGYVNYKGTEYEIDPATFGFVKTSIQQAQQKNGGARSGSGLSQGCQNAVGKLKINDFVTNLTNEGTADVGGTGTTHVSGDLVISTALDQLIKIAENPACSSQFSGATGQLPTGAQLDQAKALLSSAVKSAHVDLYVGDDNIVRRITLDLKIEPPAGSGSSGPKEVDLNVDMTLSGVNETQKIEAPSGAKPLNDLFRQLGINPLSLLGNNGGLNLNGLSGAGGGGAGGIGSLLQGINGATGGSGGSNPGGLSQAYINCIQGAHTPADLQKCAGLNN